MSAYRPKRLPWPKILGLDERPAFLSDPRRACKDKPTEWFYPEVGGSPARAQRICAACPFNHATGDGACLTYALRNEPWGCWSGLTEMQRYERGGVGNGRTKPELAA